jgi:acyl-CoA thioester hydrolase
MKTFTTRTRVRYAETDASGIAYYNSYMIYFEVGRVEMFRELGLPYDRRLPIVETYCRYHAPAAFDDLLEIHTSLQEVRRCGFRLQAEVLRMEDDGSSTLLAEGFTAMVTAGKDGRPRPLPKAFREAFQT